MPTTHISQSNNDQLLNTQNMSVIDETNVSDDEEGGTRIGDIYIPPPVPPYCSTDSKGPRLIIHRIENDNFKSYAGKVVLGPFHERFTAIVGPNGSGKSNVIDSMLFVFGYRAAKIRCKRISTLLHNSARFPNIKSCSVAVHFRQIEDVDDNSFKVIPNSEIVIKRFAFRDNSSHYTINERKVQFKEVAKLLKLYNIDLDHNRFLILQGEVESIAMMKPKGISDNECGMLEYLEDIVGTTRYKEPLIKINERVEQLTEERTEKHNRCKLAERDMKDLQQPYDEAIEYLKAENENTRLKNLRIRLYLREKNIKLNEYIKERDIIKTELQENDEKLVTAKGQREEKETQVRKELAEFDKLKKNKDNIEEKKKEVTRKIEELQQTMKMTNNRRKENKKQLEKLEEDLIELKKIPEKNKKEVDECNKKLEKLNNQKQEKEVELQANYKIYESETQSLVDSRVKLETDFMDLNKNKLEAKSNLTISESKLQIFKRTEITETRKYETMKTSFEDSKKNLQEMNKELNNLKTKNPEIEKQINMNLQSLQNIKHEEANLQIELTKIKSQIQEKTNMEQATKSNKILHSLMRQKQEGKLLGILGRLGDLGAIDTKYDVAISTACGRLDNIVVDTVNTAQDCIEYLKTYDLGRASFIALEKVNHWSNKSGPIKTPEEVPRLYDLIRVEDRRVLPAFYFSLRNTLVANDLEQATRIAYGAQRYRVVALNGDIIEMSGTMSGGGRTQMRGKMGTKVQANTKMSLDSSTISQNTLKDAQILAEKLQSNINYNQEEEGRLESKIHVLKKDHQKNENEIKKLSITIQSLEEQLPRIFKQLNKQEVKIKEATTNPEEVKALENEIGNKKQELEKWLKAAENFEKKIGDINMKINEIHDRQIKCIQTKINQVQAQIDKLNANIAKLTVDINTSKRNTTKVENQIEQLKQEIKKAEQDIMEFSSQRKSYEEEDDQLKIDLEKFQVKIENVKSVSSDFQKDIVIIQKLESDLKLKRIEIEKNLQTVTSKLCEVQSQIPHWEDQLRLLKFNKIPSEEAEQFKTYTEEELAQYNLQKVQYDESIQEEKLKKKPNLSCVNEFINRKNIYLERVKVLEDITSKRNEMRQLYDDVRKKRYDEFIQGFHIITRKLKEMYQMITQGGDAELELVDSMDPFTEGVSFSVRPPKKSWKNISNLSGGEKTLSSLALVFALHYYKPSPVYFMDEIDAALDFKNISIVAHYIKERTKNAQFIIISLRSNMFELADYLSGIYKIEDCTNSVTIRNDTVGLCPVRSSPCNLQTFSENILENEENAPFTVYEEVPNDKLDPVNISNVENSLRSDLERIMTGPKIDCINKCSSSVSISELSLPEQTQNEFTE